MRTFRRSTPQAGTRRLRTAAAVFAATMLLAAATTAPVLASQDLYGVTVAVDDRQATTRMRAFSEALEVLIVRLAGRSALVGSDRLSAALADPDPLVSQYRYDVGGPAGGELLRVVFDRGAVRQLLAEADRVLWGAQRPVLMAWVAVQDGRVRRLVDAQAEAEPVGQALLVAAERRGVPLVLPVLDLAERQEVSVSDVWGGFVERLRTVAQGYDVDGLLLGRIAGPTAQGAWTARWELRLARQERPVWTTSGESAEVVARAGLERVADHLVERFGVAPGQGETRLLVRVKGVRSLGDYADALQRLGSVAPVELAQVQRINSDGIEITTRIRGSVDALRELLALDDRFVEERRRSDEATLSYRYRP